jgi:hypothetical protein
MIFISSKMSLEGDLTFYINACYGILVLTKGIGSFEPLAPKLPIYPKFDF